MIDELKQEISKIKSEIVDLELAAEIANSEAELNAIGAQVLSLEVKLVPFIEALLIAEEISTDLAAVKRKIQKI